MSRHIILCRWINTKISFHLYITLFGSNLLWDSSCLHDDYWRHDEDNREVKYLKYFHELWTAMAARQWMTQLTHTRADITNKIVFNWISFTDICCACLNASNVFQTSLNRGDNVVVGMFFGQSGSFIPGDHIRIKWGIFKCSLCYK